MFNYLVKSYYFFEFFDFCWLRFEEISYLRDDNEDYLMYDEDIDVIGCLVMFLNFLIVRGFMIYFLRE